MMQWPAIRLFVLLPALVSSVVASSAYAESSRTVQWSNFNFVHQVGAGKRLEVRFKDLLADTGSKNLTFNYEKFEPENVPPWVTVVTTGNLDDLGMFGVAPTAEEKSRSFRVSVQDNVTQDNGGIANHVIQVVPTLEWVGLNNGQVDFGKQPERTLFRLNLLDHIRVIGDTNGDEVVEFSSPNINQKLPWLDSFSGAGIVLGTPLRANIGAYSDIDLVAQTKSEKQPVSIKAFGEVVLDPACPAWIAETFTLASADEQVLYEQTVFGQNFVVDPEAANFDYELQFVLTEGAPSGWVSVTPDTAIVSGTPGVKDGGKTDSIEIELRANIQGKVCADKAKFNITINDTIQNKPPVWLEVPIQLGNNLQPGQAIDVQICDKVTDPDSGPGILTVERVAGVPTINLIGDCSAGQAFLRGTAPAIGGEFKVQLIATDTEADTPNEAVGIVFIDDNKPPECLNQPWELEAVESAPKAIDLNTSDFVFDPDGDPISFTNLDPSKDFVSLALNGLLSINAKKKDVELHEFDVTIQDDGGLSATCKLKLKIKPKGGKPIITDPYYKACIDEYFDEDLKLHTTDPSYPVESLTYLKISDPFDPLDRWLNVSENGLLTGTPGQQHISQNEYTIEVRNEESGAQYPIHILVKKCDGTGPNVYPIDPHKKGAYSDNLWIIESHIACPPPCPPNPCPPPCPTPGPCRNMAAGICGNYSDGTEIGNGSELGWQSSPRFPVNTFAYQFNLGLKDYYEILSSAGIRHHDAWISTDTQYRGKLLKPKNGSLISTFEEGAQWVLNMGDRLRFYSDDSGNSPIRSMRLLYNQAPDLSVWQQEFWRPGVPMDAMVLTSSDTEIGSLGNYTEDYIDFHYQNDQNYRTSAITSDCRYPGHAFSNVRRLVDATSPSEPGNQFWNDGCKIATRSYMSEYAHRVVFRARVVYQKRLALDDVPDDPSKITVTIAGIQIPSSKWSYEPSPPTVVMHWRDINISRFKPDDQIVIKY